MLFGILGPLEVLARWHRVAARRRSSAGRAGPSAGGRRPCRSAPTGWSRMSGTAGPPSTAAKTLQKYVSELRKTLPGPVSPYGRAGYVLDVDPDVVDARRFERLVEPAGLRGRARRCGGARCWPTSVSSASSSRSAPASTSSGWPRWRGGWRWPWPAGGTPRSSGELADLVDCPSAAGTAGGPAPAGPVPLGPPGRGPPCLRGAPAAPRRRHRRGAGRRAAAPRGGDPRGTTRCWTCHGRSPERWWLRSRCRRTEATSLCRSPRSSAGPTTWRPAG